MLSEVVTWIEELAKSSGLTIDDTDVGLYEIAGVMGYSIEYAEYGITRMARVTSKATGVDAETTSLTTKTTRVVVDAQLATEVYEVMDIDVDTVCTAYGNSSPDAEPEGTEELEGTDELEILALAIELDTAVTQQLTNSSDDMDIRYEARSGRHYLRPRCELDYGLLMHSTMSILGLKFWVNKGRLQIYLSYNSFMSKMWLNQCIHMSSVKRSLQMLYNT